MVTRGGYGDTSLGENVAEIRNGIYIYIDEESEIKIIIVSDLVPISLLMRQQQK